MPSGIFSESSEPLSKQVTFISSEMSKEGELSPASWADITSQINSAKLRQSNDSRTSALVNELSETKARNVSLQKELQKLKEETLKKEKHTEETVSSFTVEIAALNGRLVELIAIKENLQESHDDILHKWSVNIEKLSAKLSEAQASRDQLFDAVGAMEKKLKEVESAKKEEIEQLKHTHKLEWSLSKNVSNEAVLKVRKDYTAKLERMNNFFTKKIRELEDKHAEEAAHLTGAMQDYKENFDKVTKEKDEEIARLENVVQEECNKLQSEVVTLRSKMLDKCSNEGCLNLRTRVLSLEGQVTKLEKTKKKYLKCFEAKLSSMHKERSLMEYSFQLQLMEQRARLLNETSNESHSELSEAVNKLEVRFKEIVGAIQVAAVKRRLQDQQSLESLLGLVMQPTNDCSRVSPTAQHYTFNSMRASERSCCQKITKQDSMPPTNQARPIPEQPVVQPQ